ncbi:MAG TPA: hypothetical protein PLB05_02845 [Candidatus Omnitrophota bacterium]|nr:hypothetical protein [Candidatus Omnitrophota bacterium]
MNILIVVIMILLSGLQPACAANPRVQLEPMKIIVKGVAKDLTKAQGFQMRSQMYVKQKADAVSVDDEVFILQVRIRNYTREKLSVSQDGWLRDDDWLVDIPGLAVSVESDQCKIVRISSEDIDPCQGSVRFEEIGPRMARDMNLVLRFTGAVQSGGGDFKVGLKVKPADGSKEEVVWTRPIGIYIDPWPVREFLMFWNEKEGWRNQQREMRDKKETGLISRYYVPGGGVRVEENYEGGKLNGARRTYFENGVIKEEEHYRDGRLHGEKFVYQRNKKLTMYEIYLAGERVGFVRFSSFDQKRDQQEKMARVRALMAKEYPQLKPDLKVELIPPEERAPALSPELPVEGAVPLTPE